jgi:hypothetical protein
VKGGSPIDELSSAVPRVRGGGCQWEWQWSEIEEVEAVVGPAAIGDVAGRRGGGRGRRGGAGGHE